jgi:diguanylate cyclase (GGDEF)-like protein/PAS domain S-box-containing protein
VRNKRLGDAAAGNGWLPGLDHDLNVMLAATEDLIARNVADQIGGLGQLPLNTLFDQLPEHIFIKDRFGRFVFANAALIDAHPAAGGQLIGKSDFDLFDRDTASGFYAAEQQLMDEGCAVRDRMETYLAATGRPKAMLTTKSPLRNAAGAVIGLIGIARDITERQRQDDLRRGHAGLLEMIARGQPLAQVLQALVELIEAQLQGLCASVLLFDSDKGTLQHGAAPRLSPSYLKLIDGTPISDQKGSCGTAAWSRQPVIASDVQTDPRWADCRSLGALYGFRSCWSTPILDAHGALLGTFALYSAGVREPTVLEDELMAMATDIAGIAIGRKRAEDRIQFMAHHDPLTGLANRTLFWEQFSKILNQARRENRKLTVTYIDLDNFKQINDRFGHGVGDQVLKQLAQRLSNCIRATDLAVRLGGDEFALVFSNPSCDEQDIVRRLHEIRSEVSRPVDVDDLRIRATCSMGVAFFPQDGEAPDTLLASADAAMYRAKERGRDTLIVSDLGLRVDVMAG